MTMYRLTGSGEAIGRTHKACPRSTRASLLIRRGIDEDSEDFGRGISSHAVYSWFRHCLSAREGTGVRS